MGDHLDFCGGRPSPKRLAEGRFPVFGSNGVIGRTTEPNARGPVIVVGRVGTYCGSLHYCASDVWVTDNALACRARNPGETRFWYYALQDCRLNEHRAGSSQPLLNQAILQDLSVPAVAAHDRMRIGALLGAVDDKIDANKNIIKAAEALKVAIAGSVADRVAVSRLANRSTALREPGTFADVVAHFSLPAFDDGATPEVGAGAAVKSAKFLLSRPCVLFAKLNPRIPRIWNVATLPPEMALASSEFVALTPNGVDTSALWAALRQPEVSETVRQQVIGTSSSHQRIRPGDLLEVQVPDVRCLDPTAARTVTSLGELCQSRRLQSARLVAYRDALLPQLMSGQAYVTAPGLG